MRRMMAALVLVGVCVGLAGLQSLCSEIPMQLSGLWVNQNLSATDITKLAIFLGPQGLMAQGYNYCSVVDCAWDPAPLYLGGYPPVQDIPMWGLSSYEVGDIKSVVDFRFEGGTMILEYYLIWTDLSIPAHKSTNVFRRVSYDVACTECLEQLNAAFLDQLLWVPNIDAAVAQAVFDALPLSLVQCMGVTEIEMAIGSAASITSEQAYDVVVYFCPELYEYELEIP